MKVKQFSIIALASIITAGISSCSKDKDHTTIPIEEEYDARVIVKEGQHVNLSDVSNYKFIEGTLSRKNNVYSLRDLRVLEEIEEEVDGETILVKKASTTYGFDFKENDVNSNEEAALTFSASTRNNLQVNLEKGYRLYYINKPFESVNANDTFIEAEDGTMGFEGTFFPHNEGKGWAVYTGNPTHQIVPVENRTIVLFKEGKPIFKFRINSVYSGEQPEKEIAPNNYFYYSVDYQEFK